MENNSMTDESIRFRVCTYFTLEIYRFFFAFLFVRCSLFLTIYSCLMRHAASFN